MYKLNLTEIELRKKTIDETKDNMVHTKNNVLIDCFMFYYAHNIC